MRPLTVFAAAVLACGNLWAAIFGPFSAPDALRPTLYPTAGHGDRMVVIIPLSSGMSMVLYLPSQGEPAPDGRVLDAIGRRLEPGGDIQVFDLGGRPWFGTVRRMDNNVLFHDGYAHKNGYIYNIAFSLDAPATVTPEVREILSRIGVVPELRHAPSGAELANARDSLMTGDPNQAESYLRHAENIDPNRSTLHYLRGALLEANGEYENALGEFARAAHLDPGDIETATRHHGVSAILGDAGTAVAQLSALAEQKPDEPTPWEELGTVYFHAGQTDVAIPYYQQALMVNPASEAALFNLAHIHAERGDYANSYRNAHALRHYRPWIGDDQLPDYAGLYDPAAMRDIAGEPLPLGHIAAYGPTATQLYTPQEIRTRTVTRYADPYVVIPRPQPKPAISLPLILENLFGQFLNPGNRPHRPRPPSTPGARPPAWSGGGHPPGARPPSPPPSDRPERPRPPPGSAGDERPRPPHPPAAERPGRPRPPGAGESERPQTPRPPSADRPERPRPPGDTPPPKRIERPAARPAPSRPTTRPSAPEPPRQKESPRQAERPDAHSSQPEARQSTDQDRRQTPRAKQPEPNQTDDDQRNDGSRERRGRRPWSGL